MSQSKAFALLLALALPLFAQAPARTATPGTLAERRTAKAFEDAKEKGPLALHVFLVRMPKGADLHMHLSGAIYAETFLKDAAEDGLCVDSAKLAFVHGNAGKPCKEGSCSCRQRSQGPAPLRRTGRLLLHALLHPLRRAQRA